MTPQRTIALSPGKPHAPVRFDKTADRDALLSFASWRGADWLLTGHPDRVASSGGLQMPSWPRGHSDYEPRDKALTRSEELATI